MSTTERATHTPGPLRVAYRRAFDEQIGEYGCVVSLVIGDQIIDLGHTGFGNSQEALESFGRAEANARRIVACWNACASIPTEVLEKGVVREMVTVLERCEAILDSLECECDEYNGFTCSIHEDRAMVDRMLAKVRGEAS